MDRKTILVLLERGLFTERLVNLLAELDGDFRTVVDWARHPLDLAPSGMNGVALVLLDLDRLGDSAATTIEALSSRAPGVRLVGFGRREEQEYVDSLLGAGLAGYVPKDWEGGETRMALAQVLRGSGYRPVGHPPGVVQSIGRNARTAADFGLTPAESAVLSLLAQGKTNREIAFARGTRPSTVRIQLTPIFRKLAVQTRGQAIIVALRHGLAGGGPDRTAPDAPLDLTWLMPHMKYRRHPRGHVIFREGDVGEEMFLIQRGRVSISDVEDELREHDVFGEIGVFAPDHRRTHSATCSTDVDLWALPEDKAKQLCVTDPAFALRMLKLVAMRLSSDTRRAA